MASSFHSFTVRQPPPQPFSVFFDIRFGIPLIPLLDRPEDFHIWDAELVRFLRQHRLIAAIRVDQPRFYLPQPSEHEPDAFDGDAVVTTIIRTSLSPVMTECS
jgi:hypothetical protein